MLSKVLRRADSSSAHAIVFQQVREVAGPSLTSLTTNAPLNESSSALLEKVRSLECRLASETRAAFEAGKKEGEKAALAEMQPVLQKLAASTTEVLAMRSELRHRAEADVVKLALSIARRILHRQLAVDDSALTALARLTFERLTRAESYRITVHPRFAAAITSALPASRAGRVQIDQDPGCSPGTLIVHSPEGTIDASIDAQLDEIDRGLSDRLQRS